MAKIKKLIEDFCVEHKLFYKPKIKELYVEKHRLALLLKGIELKVHIIDCVGKNDLYVPYIVKYYNKSEEMPWWEFNYRLHAYSENQALYILIKQIYSDKRKDK